MLYIYNARGNAAIFRYFVHQALKRLSLILCRISGRKQSVDDFLRYRKIPQPLADRIRGFYAYIIDREVQNDEADIIAGMSTALRTEVVLFLYRDTLEKVPFFKGKHTRFIAAVVTYLKMEYYGPVSLGMERPCLRPDTS